MTEKAVQLQPIQRISRNEAAYLLQKALDEGIDFFDTARAYTGSEEKIGYAYSARRGQFTLATKTMSASAESFWNDLHTSLKQLNTDCIDISPAGQEKMARIDQCVRCNHCADHCPYGLNTPELLRRVLIEEGIPDGDAVLARYHDINAAQWVLLEEGRLT